MSRLQVNLAILIFSNITEIVRIKLIGYKQNAGQISRPQGIVYDANEFQFKRVKKNISTL